MRTPILIQTGSFTVLSDEELTSSYDQRADLWEYRLRSGNPGKATIDVIACTDDGFVVRPDRQPGNPFKRVLRLSMAGVARPVLEASVTPGRGLVFRSPARAAEGTTSGRRSYTFAPDPRPRPPFSYGYELVYPSGPPAVESGLQHLAVVLNPGPAPLLPRKGKGGGWKWLALCAGLGVAGSVLLRKAVSGSASAEADDR